MGCYKLDYCGDNELGINSLRISRARQNQEQGEEKEIVGTGYYYYGARYYEPRLSLMLSVDPMTLKYPGVNPYAYCFQNPINHTDPTGREPEDIIITGTDNSKFKYVDGKLYNADGSQHTGKIDAFTQKTVDALGSISKSAEGAAMVSELQSSSNVFNIQKADENNFTAGSSRKSFANIPELQELIPGMSSSGSGGTINFNPNSTSSGLNTNGNTDRPSF
jgi:RHS repeat-associated protein